MAKPATDAASPTASAPQSNLLLSGNTAGLIVSERLRSEIKGLSQAVTNSERASSVVATTEGYLAEVADLLNSIRGLIVEAANRDGLSREEIALLRRHLRKI